MNKNKFKDHLHKIIALYMMRAGINKDYFTKEEILKLSKLKNIDFKDTEKGLEISLELKKDN